MFSPYSRVQNFISFLGYIYSIKSYYLIFLIINPLKNSKLYSFSSSKICHVLRIITFIFIPVINMNAFRLFFIEVPCLVTFFFGWIWKIFHRWAIAVISIKVNSEEDFTIWNYHVQCIPWLSNHFQPRRTIKENCLILKRNPLLIGQSLSFSSESGNQNFAFVSEDCIMLMMPKCI